MRNNTGCQRSDDPKYVVDFCEIKAHFLERFSHDVGSSPQDLWSHRIYEDYILIIIYNIYNQPFWSSAESNHALWI